MLRASPSISSSAVLRRLPWASPVVLDPMHHEPGLAVPGDAPAGAGLSLHPLSPAAVGAPGVSPPVLLALLVGESRAGCASTHRMACPGNARLAGKRCWIMPATASSGWICRACDSVEQGGDRPVRLPCWMRPWSSPDRADPDAGTWRRRRPPAAQEALAGQATPPFETQRSRRGGGPVDVEVSAGPMFDADGSVVGAAGAGRRCEAGTGWTRQSYAEDLGVRWSSARASTPSRAGPAQRARRHAVIGGLVGPQSAKSVCEQGLCRFLRP